MLSELRKVSKLSVKALDWQFYCISSSRATHSRVDFPEDGGGDVLPFVVLCSPVFSIAFVAATAAPVSADASFFSSFLSSFLAGALPPIDMTLAFGAAPVSPIERTFDLGAEPVSPIERTFDFAGAVSFFDSIVETPAPETPPSGRLAIVGVC